MENKNKRKFSARGIVTFFAFWLLIASFLFIFQTCTQAINPMPTAPSETYGEIVDASVLTDLNLSEVIGVFNAQYQYGGFDSFVPLLLYRSGNSLRLCFTNGSLPYDLETGYYLDPDGGISLASPLSQSVRFLMTEYGFKAYVVGVAPSNVPLEDVIFYRNTGGSWVDNSENFATSNGVNNTNISTAFSRWLLWVSQTTTGGGGGGDGSQVIVNELDIGSIIASLPQAARNILDSTFGFELFGINIAATLTAVLLVTIVAFVIKWLMSR